MYTIELTSEAEDDLKWFDRRDRNIIVDGIQTNLSYEPTVNRFEILDLRF
jgi:mRNA-degrading endonuclease RelE of RelBE toxin-antitoxin system